MDKKLLTIAVALLIVAIVAVPAAAAPAVGRIVSPTLLSPKNNAGLTNGDHLVMLEWKPVDDARVSHYLVEVEGYSPPWDWWVGFTSTPRTTTDTWYQVDCFACCSEIDGFHEYRWRVTAVSDDAGATSAPSKWQYFSFPGYPPEVSLATVRLLSPDNKMKISAGTSLSYNWELIPGDIVYYLLIHEKLSANNEWRGDSPTTVFGNGPTLPYSSSQWQTTTGYHRWRIFAIGSGQSYSLSPWRYYTVV